MAKISVQDLATVLVERNSLDKKEASSFISEMFDIVQQELEKDKVVKIKGLGTFKIIDVDDRESVNVNTGERVLIEGHGKITFTPDGLMKELVNKPFSQFETVVLNEGVDFKDETEPEPEPVEDQLIDVVEPQAIPLVDFGETVSMAAVEQAPVKTEAPVVEKEPEPEEDRVEEDIVEEDIVEETDDEDDTTEEDPAETSDGESPIEADAPVAEGGNKWLIACLACIAGLVIGYLCGNYFPFTSPQEPAQNIVVKKAEISKPESKAAPKPAAPAVAEQAKPDTAEAVAPTKTEPAAPTKAEPAAPAKAESAAPAKVVAATPAKPVAAAPAKAEPVKPATKEQAPAKAPKPQPAAASATLHDKYAAKDIRVRLGAYRIVGTDQVVKAKQGETLAKISRRYFGPDMECYLEVYNNLKVTQVLTPGQEIKIPKLVHKKKKTASAKH